MQRTRPACWNKKIMCSTIFSIETPHPRLLIWICTRMYTIDPRSYSRPDHALTCILSALFTTSSHPCSLACSFVRKMWLAVLFMRSRGVQVFSGLSTLSRLPLRAVRENPSGVSPTGRRRVHTSQVVVASTMRVLAAWTSGQDTTPSSEEGQSEGFTRFAQLGDTAIVWLSPLWGRLACFLSKCL